jgi:hypothetical protein
MLLVQTHDEVGQAHQQLLTDLDWPVVVVEAIALTVYGTDFVLLCASDG